MVTPTISKQLEDGQSADLYNAIRQDGIEGYWGMQTMNQCLDDYACKGYITEEEAMLNAGNIAELKQECCGGRRQPPQARLTIWSRGLRNALELEKEDDVGA